MMQFNSKKTAEDYSEFESYAIGYSGGMDDPIKKLCGRSFEAFIEIKVKWLLDDLKKNPLNYVTSINEIKLLDFGCGIGTFLQGLIKFGFTGKIEGCDISEGMLKEVVAHWHCGYVPKLHLIKEGHRTPFATGSFDIVIACCVLHHIQLSQSMVFEELARILKPAGRLVIFEHNPFNPITKLLVKRGAIDKNAVLIKPSVIKKELFLIGFQNVRLAHILFFPPRFRWHCFEVIEKFLGWLPLGGQYVIVAEKPKAKIE